MYRIGVMMYVENESLLINSVYLKVSGALKEYL